MKKYKINKKKCIGCGACISSCPYGAISMDVDGKVLIDDDKCKGCGKCASFCPFNAIDKLT
jgi:ferredoxin